MREIDVRILGPLEVERDGELCALGGRRPRSVLAVLVLQAREVISPERLADAVWDGEPPASADTTLRSYVSNLRKVLEPDRAASDQLQILRTTPNGYVLDVDDDQIDARRFERLVAEGRERRAVGDLSAAVEHGTEALDLWRGDVLQDFTYASFAQSEIARLNELRQSCTEDLFDARIELGQHETVVGDLEAFCAAHPGRERALRLRMLALYRCGRQEDALVAYDQGRRRLAYELGIDPSPELRELHERIVRQDDGLAVATDAPSGKQTLTFLLGDVERSTEKLRVLGEEYPAVLEEHRRVLKEVFGEHGGRGVRTWGDGVFAAFDGATDAVDAAVATQLALSSFDPDRTLPVRMGLHTGEATFSGGEFVGLSIHLAARIMDAAHGGQILVSGATKELYEAEESVEVALVDTGVHALKDFPDALRLFQVTHPGLRREFPRLRTLAVRASNLPQRATSFVGRERDLEEIAATLAEARVVTLTGVGGVGKTRLALEAGRGLVSRYPDGVWLCELAAVGDPEGLIQSMASTLDVRQQQGMSMRESLLAALRQRESLLVIDNCEHLLEPVAELAEDIVAECPSVDVLATSREVIGVDGERARPVRSLKASADDATSAAMRLFADRARDARPDFHVDERNAADVAEVCAKLDGIPLAIELAAARVTSLSPAQIAKRLEEGFRFLRSGRRAAVDRHRTLHGAIDWSYAMLSEAEQVLFGRLSVFAGSFTLEAAEEVCGSGFALDVADGIASLVAKSMVSAEVGAEEARYFLLETMRQYAQDRLAERGEADEILRRHATHFVRFLESSDAFNGDSERQSQALTLSFDDLRAAHAWTIATGEVDLVLRMVAFDSFFFYATAFTEVFGWAGLAVTLPGAEEHPMYPVALELSAYDLIQIGEREASEATMRRARDLLDDPDDPRRLRMAMSGNPAFFEGRTDAYFEHLEDQLRLARRHGDQRLEFLTLYAYALSQAYAGELAAALVSAERCCALARGRSTLVHAYAEYAMGEVLRESGELDRALDCLQRAIGFARANGNRFGAGVALVSAASIRGLKDVPGALEMFREAIDHFRLGGLWVLQWTTLRNLAELFGRTGDDEAALVLLAASESSPTAVPSYGAQAERLTALEAELIERLGAEAYGAAVERGEAMSDGDVVAYAKAEIDRAAEASRVAEV